jgi:hypothetical protein
MTVAKALHYASVVNLELPRAASPQLERRQGFDPIQRHAPPAFGIVLGDERLQVFPVPLPLHVLERAEDLLKDAVISLRWQQNAVFHAWALATEAVQPRRVDGADALWVPQKADIPMRIDVSPAGHRWRGDVASASKVVHEEPCERLWVGVLNVTIAPDRDAFIQLRSKVSPQQ